LCWPNGDYEKFLGLVKGELVFPPRGTNGHGYDPIFVPEGHTRTVAEMNFSEKNSCSHRFIAVQSFIDECLSQLRN
jgi:XTP/dITP diphosphohydrolase